MGGGTRMMHEKGEDGGFTPTWDEFQATCWGVLALDDVRLRAKFPPQHPFIGGCDPHARQRPRYDIGDNGPFIGIAE